MVPWPLLLHATALFMPLSRHGGVWASLWTLADLTWPTCYSTVRGHRTVAARSDTRNTCACAYDTCTYDAYDDEDFLFTLSYLTASSWASLHMLCALWLTLSLILILAIRADLRVARTSFMHT